MKKIIFPLLLCVILTEIVFTLTQCTPTEKKISETPTAMTPDQQIERGRYMVNAGACNDCHTPKKFTDKGMIVNEDLLLSGYPEDEKLPDIDTSEITPGKWYLGSSGLDAWVGPWGVSFGSNLTPDTLTGIGGWTEELFLKTLRTGQFMGIESGRPIMPPMPWESISKMSDDDLKAIFAYLRSIKPIRNNVPSYIPRNEIQLAKKSSDKIK